MQRYDDAEVGNPGDRTNGRDYQIINQAYLQAKHDDSTAFMGAAVLNGNLINGKLAGLNNATYRDVFHLRPGVEIVSKTADGDLVVQGDLDLSRYRYAGVNPRSPLTGVYGSGEVGALILRAKGNLDVYGSINDGFAPPPESPDDASGWQLVEGRYGLQAVTPYGGDLVVPIGGVKLEAGSSFPAGRALNYDLPASPATLPVGTVLPVAMMLNAPLSLPGGLVLTGDVTTAGGTVLRAGTVLPGEVRLDPGAQLGAGFVLRSSASMRAFTWPKGVALPTELVASRQIVLAQGSLIPGRTASRAATGRWRPCWARAPAPGA
ncbi:hypothetical protein G6F35_012202 [Rhizopus arrhizus]|nr:hypothetical protein G6F35_012202 [Rhizopus arrhizus]